MGAGDSVFQLSSRGAQVDLHDQLHRRLEQGDPQCDQDAYALPEQTDLSSHSRLHGRMETADPKVGGSHAVLRDSIWRALHGRCLVTGIPPAWGLRPHTPAFAATWLGRVLAAQQVAPLHTLLERQATSPRLLVKGFLGISSARRFACACGIPRSLDKGAEDSEAKPIHQAELLGRGSSRSLALDAPNAITLRPPKQGGEISLSPSRT